MALAGFPTVNFAASLRNVQANAGSQRTPMFIPRTKYTFLIELQINPDAINSTLQQTTVFQYVQNGMIYGQLKSVDYPKFRYETDTLRTYNRYRKIYKRLQYDACSIVWHDDSTSMVTGLIKEYMNFYSETGSIGRYGGGRGIVSDDREFNTEQGTVGQFVRDGMSFRQSLGLRLRPQYMRHFFDSITIYDLGSEPTAINVHTFHRPVITSFSRDALDYSSTDLISTTWSLEYEGYFFTAGQNVDDFADIIDNILVSKVS